jgi:transcription antitermination factor NusG
MLAAAVISENLEARLFAPDRGAEVPAPVNDYCMVLVRPGQEQEARDSMRRRGVGAWWPNYKREVVRKDPRTGRREKRLVLSPIIAGVILSPARCDERFWQAVDVAPGVLNVAYRFGGDLLLLRDVDVVLIHKIEAGHNKPAPPKPLHDFKIGDRVRLLEDTDHVWPPCEVIQCSRRGNIKIESPLLGGAPVDVLPHQIVRC